MRLISFRKYIIILVSIWLVIVIAGLIFSRSMQGKIIDILSEQTAKHLTTEIHINKNNIHFSIFKKFPLASIELRNVCFKIPPNVNLQQSIPIKGDTLLYAKNLFLQLNLRSLIDKKYELQKISLKNGYLQVLSDKKGNSSLDILQEKKSSDSASFAASINAFIVNNLTIYTSDIANQSTTETFIKQGTASGLFTKQNFAIKLKTQGRVLNFTAKNQKLEPNQYFSVDTDILYEKDRFTINRGAFNLSNIPFTVVGTITPGDNTLIDLIFSAKSVPIKQIDKAILRGVIGETGFEPRGGTINIQSTLIGYTRYNLPSIKASFSIKQGKVFDTERKLLYEGIYILGNADNGKSNLPKTTTIRIDTFSFKTGNSWQAGKVKIQNLITPTLSATMHGNVNISDVNKLIVIPDLQFVEGTMRNNVAISGRINKNSKKENSLLEGLEIWGDLSIKELGLVFEKYKIPYTVVSGDIRMAKDLSLSFDSLAAKSGHSDILINGKLSNALKKGKISIFQGSLNSEYFLADDFISPSTPNTKNSKAVVFPDSIIINGSIKIKQFSFGKFTTENLNGKIRYNKKHLWLDPFSMNGFQGSLSGNIALTSEARLSKVNIKQLFEGCNNFSQDVISSEHLNGTISGSTNFSSEWTNRLELIPGKIINQSEIVILNGELINYQPLMGLSKFINVEELKRIKFDKLQTSVSIHNKKVILDQTTIASSAITFDGSGIHDFDNKYEYKLQLGLSDVLLRKAKKKKKDISEFGYVIDDGVGHTIIPLVLSGIGTNFNVKYDKRKARESFKQKLREEKQELRELFKSEDSLKQEKSQELRIEHETIEKKPLQKTDSGTYKVKSQEHSIIWDDSPDEEEEEEEKEE